MGNVLAAMLGIVTPFCSCSAVPLFIGFVESGIPLGVTFSFLIAAPTINEVAVVMLFGLFGWRVAGLYIASGLVIAIVAGMVIGRLNLERYVEDFVWQMQVGGRVAGRETDLGRSDPARLGVRQRNRRQGLAVRGDRHRRWRWHPRLRAGERAGGHHGQTGLVVGAGGGAAGRAAVFQCRRGHPDRERVDGKRRLAWARCWPS